MTLLDAIQKSLAACTRHAPGEAPPAAILWPDADAQWQPLIPRLRAVMPQLLSLGDYAPDQRQGPAIWLRCVLERALSETPLAPGVVPIFYLPNIAWQTLRAVTECPEPLLPLVELQYRGTVWRQGNGKDWTVEAFLTSADGGLELDVATDQQTRRAMLGALSELALTPLARLSGKRLEAEDFDHLMVEDMPRNLLDWMNAPHALREKWDEQRWAAFCAQCKSGYQFDPAADGELVAAERLGMREVEWFGVWQRFVEAPGLYPNLPGLLRRAKPRGRMFVKETWPDENEEMEDSLRKRLEACDRQDAASARTSVAQLEKEHAQRRHWVWAKLGQSSLVRALQHLAALATHTAVQLGGDSPAAMAALYADGGYLADDALLRALAEAKAADDLNAVSVAARAMYLPWLEHAAEHFQSLVKINPLPSAETHGEGPTPIVEVQPGTCILFVDGLRFDLGQRLCDLAQGRKLRVVRGRRWAAVPTVTGTAKPAVSPIAGQFAGHQLGGNFAPDIAATGQSATSERVGKLMTTAGYQCIPATDLGRPHDINARGWTEFGEFDTLGHKLQVKMAQQVNDQLDSLIERIARLLAAGWRQVRVVTDHGWLLAPGALPNMQVPKYLTPIRWARVALINDGARVAVPTAGWYWNAAETFAFGAGISCFGSGNAYAHGGLSLQECVVPDLIISSDIAAPQVAPAITAVQWHGLRCRVAVEPAGVQAMADIRTKPADGATSIAAPRSLDGRGNAALLVEDDSLIGASATVVLFDNTGRVLAKNATIVGGEE